MPTENRSSNTEMVSVQATIESLEEAYAGDSALGFMNDAAQLLRQLKAISTPQPHPEPIAWMVGTAIWWTKAEAERDSNEIGEPAVPLGPCADPGEVERLRAELGYMREERDDLSSKLDRFYSRTHGIKNLAAIEQLSAQLAERDALLGPIAGWTAEAREAVLEAFQDELNESASYAWYDAAIADLMKLVEAVSASAEPSAAVEIDHDALVAAVCVLRSQGLGNLSAAVEEARAALERKPS